MDSTATSGSTRVDALRLADWAPAAAVSFLALVGVVANQGGYFPTTWGPAALGLLAVVTVWLVADGRSDAGRLDVALVTALLLFLAWTAASIVWSVAPANSVLEVERVLVLVAGVAALLAVARNGAQPYVAMATVLALVACGAYSLGERLFPSAADFDPISGYRLSGVVGYWNGLGILMAVASVLAFGAALDRRLRWARVAAAGALVVLLPTLYFTFSRGAWIGLGVGMLVVFTVSRRRVATLGGLALLAPWPALAVVAALRSHALTNEDAALAAARADGHRLAVVIAVLCVVAALAALALIRLEDRIVLSARARRAVGGGAVVLLAAAVAIGLVAVDGPSTLAHRAIDGFKRTEEGSGSGDLNEHLFTFSGTHRVDHWTVAWDAYREHSVLGAGAGTYERFWQAFEDAQIKVRDAHNLYLETLTELGPVGLALLLAIIGIVAIACVRAREDPIVPAALGAFVAYAVHASVDWDWELTGLTLAAFLPATAGVLALRRTSIRRMPGWMRAGAAGVLVAAVATAGVGYMSNIAQQHGQNALDAKSPAAAVDYARDAHTWAPWSPYPLTLEGEALLAAGEPASAARAFRSALDTDSGYWRAWLGLAVASKGSAREAALEHARTLYPRSNEIYETEQLLNEP